MATKRYFQRPGNWWLPFGILVGLALCFGGASRALMNGLLLATYLLGVLGLIFCFLLDRLPTPPYQYKKQIIAGDMNAPWEEFPQYSCVTMGWREGCGEHYMQQWISFFESLSRAVRARYMSRHPESAVWLDFYGRITEQRRLSLPSRE